MNSEEFDKRDEDVVVITDVEEVAPESEQSGAEEPRKGSSEEPKRAGEKIILEPEKSEKKGRPFPGWMDLFSTAGVFLFSALLGGIILMIMMKARGVEAPTPDMTFVSYLVQMLPVVVFLVILRRKAGRGNAIHLGLRRVNMPMVLWGVLLLMATGVVVEPILALFPTEAYDGVKDVIGLGGWAILSAVVAAPILEEVLFRGLIFESCRERFGRGAAVLISALLFGLIHVIPVQVINAFVVGLILGYVYLKTNSLLSVIILHGVNNAIAYATMALLGADANVTLKEMMSSSWLYWIIYALSAALFIFAMLRLYRTLRDNTEVE